MTEKPAILKGNFQKVAEAVEVGKSSVYRVISEYNRKSIIVRIKSPQQKINNFSKCAIRWKEHVFF